MEEVVPDSKLLRIDESMPRYLKKGFAWNPLVGLPRNMLCPCGSGRKFKACHLDGMPRVIPAKLAREYAAQMQNDLNLLKFVGDEKQSP